MTRVRMRGQVSGTRNGQPWPQVGDTVELSDDEAQTLIRGGLAVHVHEDPPKVERAVKPPEDVEKRAAEDTASKTPEKLPEPAHASVAKPPQTPQKAAPRRTTNK
jgi:hypothetical protein